jgi:hypothetical protein
MQSVTHHWLLALVVLTLLLLPAAAFAEDGVAAFAVRPARYDPERIETRSYFVYDAVGGQLITDQVRVINTSDQPGLVRLYAVDAATGQNSGPVYLPATAERNKAGAWMTLATRELLLEAGEERLVEFVVRVPSDARTGDHLGGIVAEGATITRQADGSNFAVNLQVRNVVAVHLIVPGQRVDQLRITGIVPTVQQGMQTLVIGLHNQGTHMVKGAGKLTISDAAGAQLAAAPVQLDSILPGDQLNFPVIVPGRALAAGVYHAEFRFTTSDGKVVPAFVATINITSTHIEQIYAAQPQLLPPPSAAGRNLISWLPLFFAAVSAGFFALYLRRRLRFRH